METKSMPTEINLAEIAWRAAAGFCGGLCYVVVRRNLNPRKAVGVVTISIGFALFVAQWLSEKTGLPAAVLGWSFGFAAIWVVDKIDDGSLQVILRKAFKSTLKRWVDKP
jgi:CHASE2 domain-containing sensor protein